MNKPKGYKQVRRDLKIHLFGGRLSIVICNQPDIHYASFKNFGIDDRSLSENNAVALRRDECTPRIYPILFSYENMSPGLMAHEALHVTNSVLADVGIYANHRDDETHAYMIMWIVNRIVEANNEYIRRYVSKSKTGKSQPGENSGS